MQRDADSIYCWCIQIGVQRPIPLDSMDASLRVLHYLVINFIPHFVRRLKWCLESTQRQTRRDCRNKIKRLYNHRKWSAQSRRFDFHAEAPKNFGCRSVAVLRKTEGLFLGDVLLNSSEPRKKRTQQMNSDTLKIRLPAQDSDKINDCSN
jgi:hypothetical protein